MSCGLAMRTPTTRALRWQGSRCPGPEPGAPWLGATVTTERVGSVTSTTPLKPASRRRADVGSLRPARARAAGLVVLAMGRPWLGHGQGARSARHGSTGAAAYPAPVPCAVGLWTDAHRGSWSTWCRGRTGAATTSPTKACRTARAATDRADRWRLASSTRRGHRHGRTVRAPVAYVACENRARTRRKQRSVCRYGLPRVRRFTASGHPSFRKSRQPTRGGPSLFTLGRQARARGSA